MEVLKLWKTWKPLSIHHSILLHLAYTLSTRFTTRSSNMEYLSCFGLFKRPWKHTYYATADLPPRGDIADSASPENPPSDWKMNLTLQEKHNAAPTFSYQELAVATDRFNDDNFLGSGGFGAVYKGTLLTGQTVAVKQLDPSGIQGDKEFLVEVLMLSLLHHPNLVKLIGYCAEGTHRLLVYEYMQLGCLEDHLFDVTPDSEPMDWNTRIRIAAGAARGLSSLHGASPPVIYRDLKASNILLDEGFRPKLSDFGLAKFGPCGDNTHVSTRVMGTYGYCAPEYASTGKLTIKTDIYSFGIVLLELITGRRAIYEVNGHHKHITYWALPMMRDRKNFSQLADPLLGGNFSISSLSMAIQIVLTCLNVEANLRPNASELVQAFDCLLSKEQDDHQLPPCPNIANQLPHPDRDKALEEAKQWGKTYTKSLPNQDK